MKIDMDVVLLRVIVATWQLKKPQGEGGVLQEKATEKCEWGHNLTILKKYPSHQR